MANRKPEVVDKLVKKFRSFKDVEKNLHEIGRIKPSMISLSVSFLSYQEIVKELEEKLNLQVYSTGEISDNLKKIMVFFKHYVLKAEKVEGDFIKIAEEYMKNKEVIEWLSKFEDNYKKKIREINIVRFEKILEIARNSSWLSVLTVSWENNVPIPHWITI